MKKRWTLIVLVLLPVLLALASPLLTVELPGRISPKSPIEVALDWNGQPGLHDTVTLIAEITPLMSADNMTLRWSLPGGVISTGPVTEDLGPVTAGQTITRQRDVTFDQAGNYKIAVGARIEELPAAVWTAADVLFFDIQAQGKSRVSRNVAPLPSTKEQISTSQAQYSVSADPQQDGFWVRGRFLYEDVLFGNAFEDPPNTITRTLVPARDVKVEVWEDDGLITGPSLADDRDCTTRTDDEGYFECWVPDNDDIWGDKEPYVRFYPDTHGGFVTDIWGVDQRYYCYTGNYVGGSDIDIGTATPTDFDPMFNISDAMLDAYRYATQFGASPDQAHARYDPGRNWDQSQYNSITDEISLQDSSSDPDPYDDSVIIHEYGHFIAHHYSCDQSEGGEHDWDKHYSNELAWSEGWANYLSCAVRDFPIFINWDGADDLSGVNVERWVQWYGVTGSTNEGAVAATLWDIHDSEAEAPHDRLALGGAEIWDVVDNHMEGVFGGFGGTGCNIFMFWDEWEEAGYETDSEFAAIFAHHDTGGTTSAAGSTSAALPQSVSAQPLSAHLAAEAADRHVEPQAVTPDMITRRGIPWNVTLFLVDATGSMSEEIAATQQIMRDQVLDMDAEPFPYEYIVETFQDDGTNTLVANHFFPDIVNPPIDTITVGGGGDREEDSFAALARGVADPYRQGFDAWLFTDAAPKQDVSQGELEGLLQRREATPYFFIFGDCTDENTPRGQGAEAAPQLTPPGRLHLPRFAPAQLEECIEPYLLVAGGTNGQFLFIDESQLEDAANIVRAVMSNNAGSGRYADYVSPNWTYTWEDISDYYDWYDASGGGAWNIADRQQITLPSPFSFYGTDYAYAYIAAPGYVSFSDFASVTSNTGIPTTALPNNAIYAFWDDISAYQLPRGEAPEQTPVIYTALDPYGNFVIEYQDAYHVGTTDYETFEIILDYDDYGDADEIILQYQTVTDDSSCTVGVENAGGTIATQVAYDNPGELYGGRAIRFTPVPPQPTRDHEVIVDSLMDSVIFLLNGYSGNVDMTVYDPSDTPISDADPNVTFIQVGSVIYYRVTNPDVGTWRAEASGNGTYYFTSSSTSALVGTLQSDPSLSAIFSRRLLIDLGMSLTVHPSFTLVYPDGTFFADVELFDDGLHGDGEADDGLYGGLHLSGDDGTFYLQVDGQTPGGENFRRTALTPIRYQSMELVRLNQAENFALPGQTMDYSFRLYNDTDGVQLFSVELQSSQGWATTPGLVYVVPANSSADIPVTVNVPADSNGQVEETILTALGVGGSDSEVIHTLSRGPADNLYLQAFPDRIAPDGDQAVLMAWVQDEDGWAVADGTVVTFSTSLGSIAPLTATTANGQVSTTLTSGAVTGQALVQATSGSATRAITVEIVPAQAHSITLEAAADRLVPDGTSTTTLTIQVSDQYGNPAPDGSQVLLVVEGDEMEMGSIEGVELYTATVHGGETAVTYQSGTQPGIALIRAGVLSGGYAQDGDALENGPVAETTIWLTYDYDYHIYLPLLLKNTGGSLFRGPR